MRSVKKPDFLTISDRWSNRRQSAPLITTKNSGDVASFINQQRAFFQARRPASDSSIDDSASDNLDTFAACSRTRSPTPMSNSSSQQQLLETKMASVRIPSSASALNLRPSASPNPTSSISASPSPIPSPTPNPTPYSYPSSTPTLTPSSTPNPTGLFPGSACQENRRSSVLVRKGSLQLCPMKELELDEVFEVGRKVANGRFGAVHAAEDRRRKSQIAVKIFSKQTVKQVDFIREYNYSYFLSPHPNIIDTYEGVYSASESYYFAQELAPCGSLRDVVQTGLADVVAQSVISQIVAALEFMHNEGLVHRNLRAENVFVFNAAVSKVKLADFGLTRKQNTLVKHIDSPNAYHAPELCDTLFNEAYSVDKSVDIWAVGVLVYYILRGRYPWTKACIMCKPYWEWEQWLKRKSASLPTKWTRFTDVSLKLLKKAFNPKPKDRCSIKDVRKWIKGKWLKEVKSMSEDVLFLADDAADMTKISHSMADIAGTDRRLKRRSVLQQWLAATISTMTEISEQVVSATE